MISIVVDSLTLLALLGCSVYLSRELVKVRPLLAALQTIHEDLRREQHALEIAQTENQELFMRALDCSKKLRHCYRDRAELEAENERLKEQLKVCPLITSGQPCKADEIV